MDPARLVCRSDPFVGLAYRVDPDYTQPRLTVPEAAARRIRERLSVLYPGQADAAWAELERLMRVHWAHTTHEIREAEAAFDPEARFSERDVTLVTYGDLILAPGRRPLDTLGDFALGFFSRTLNTLHILPFHPYSSDRGFSVVSYQDVDPRLGTWEDVAELARSFRLMFDCVFNHVSSQSLWFRQFLAGDPAFQDFFVVLSSREAFSPDHLRLILRPRTSELLTPYETLNGRKYVWTTFSPDQIDLNLANPRVLLKLVEVLLQYVRRGADILRLDAVAYIWRELGTSCAHLRQAHQIVKLFRDVLDVVAPHAALITETNVPHMDNLTYFGDGRDEAQLVYNFALPPLVLHSFQAGSARALSALAARLEPPSRATAFFNFLDSHDGIGLPGAKGLLTDDEVAALCRRVEERGGFVSTRTGSDGGEVPYELNVTWFSALNPVESESLALQVDRFIASRAIALALRGVPAIYLPSFFGARNDVEAVYRDGSKRSINRGAIVESRVFEALAQPDSLPRRLVERFIDLLDKRIHEPAFHPNGPQRVLDLDERVFALLRTAPDGGSRVSCLVNVSARPVELELRPEAVGLSGPRALDLVGGRRVDLRSRLALGPYAVVWLKA